MNQVKKTFIALAALVLSAFAASPAMAQGVAFNVTSLPRQVRVEGNTEIVGEVSLTATNAGTIAVGSSITLIHSATITNPGGTTSTCVLAGPPTPCPAWIIVAFPSGNQLTLAFTAPQAFIVGDSITIAETRLNVSSLGAGTLNVTATLSGTSSAPTTNPITFNQATVPVGLIQSPSITAAPITPSVIGVDFSVKVTESFPAALTSLQDETTFSPTSGAVNGCQIIVTLSGIPSGATVTPTPPSPGSLGLNTFNIGGVTPLPPPVVSDGSPISFPFTIDGGGGGASSGATWTGSVEDVVLNFNIDPLPPVPAAVTAAVTLGPLDTSAPFRIISFGEQKTTPPGAFVDVQLSKSTYVVGETVTASVFRLSNGGSVPVAVELKTWAEVAGGTPQPIINQGAAGNITLPGGFDHDFGPAAFFPVTALFPPGNYVLGARILDPVTGELLSEDLNSFAVQ